MFTTINPLPYKPRTIRKSLVYFSTIVTLVAMPMKNGKQGDSMHLLQDQATMAESNPDLFMDLVVDDLPFIEHNNALTMP
ncbi:hypothetical protein BYT27DRAFT_7258030 [Phlegmacium glaucopus]|nr:hypothetical protein BYT27DRAFT_7258030 [Phlegmacium glaucopus]